MIIHNWIEDNSCYGMYAVSEFNKKNSIYMEISQTSKKVGGKREQNGEYWKQRKYYWIQFSQDLFWVVFLFLFFGFLELFCKLNFLIHIFKEFNQIIGCSFVLFCDDHSLLWLNSFLTLWLMPQWFSNVGEHRAHLKGS